MKVFRLIPCVVLLGLASACSDYSADPLTKAENAVDDEEYELAQNIADSLIGGKNFNTLGTGQLCRTALIYARLSEHREQDANMAMAAICMRRASELNPDSVEIFVRQLDVDAQGLIDMPRKLSNVNQYQPIPEEPIDSI